MTEAQVFLQTNDHFIQAEAAEMAVKEDKQFFECYPIIMDKWSRAFIVWREQEKGVKNKFI